MFKNITLCVLMFFSAFSYAQDTTGLIVNVPCPSATNLAVGERICLKFQVNNFSSMGGMQFQIDWNADVLEYESDSVAVAVEDATGFNNSFIASTESGKLRVAGWTTTDFVNGANLPDETTLFTVCFIAKANGAANFRLGGMEEPTFPVEVFDFRLSSLEFLANFCSDIEVTENPIDPVDPVDPVDTTATVDPIDPVDPINPPGPVEGVTVNITNSTVNVEEDFCLDVTVEGFVDVVGAQFRLVWDSSFLAFKEYTDFALPNANSSFSNSSSDLRLLWVDSGISGATIADGDLFFSVCFTALREGTATLAKDNFFPVEMINLELQTLETVFQGGEVQITGQDCSFQIELASNDVSCFGNQDGFITAIPDGLASDFTYLWSTGENTAEIDGLAGGSYSLSVTDGEGCMIVREVEIIEPIEIVVAVAEESTSPCFSDIVINAGGGNGSFQYSLDNGIAQSENVFTNIVEGTYEVVVTDGNGCVSSETITISEKQEVGTTCDDEDETTRNDVITEDCECRGKTEEELNCPTIESEVTRNICEGQSSEGYSENGTYTDIFPSANGCDSVRVLNLMLVDRIVTEVDATICEGDTISGYTERGSYIDIFSSVDGCDSLRILSLFVYSENDANCLPTSTIDIDQDQAIQVAPNPVANELTIDISNSAYLPATVTIYSIHGNLVDRYQISSPRQRIPMGNKNSGMYVLFLETPDAQFVKRIIKK